MEQPTWSSKKLSRKRMLRILGWGAAGLSGLVLWSKRSLVGNLIAGKKKRLVMVMDLDKCIGCNACTVACKSENGVALGVQRTRVLEAETGTYPNTQRFFLPMMCNHCEDAPCISACPNEAIVRRPDGLVDILKDKCHTAQLCVSACPYGAIYINPDYEPGPEVADYPARMVAKADKCNFCQHRIDEGLEPACSDTCPTDARIFGDLEDANSKVARLIREGELSGLLEEEGTRPQVYYKGGRTDVFNIKNSINARPE